MRRGSNSFYLFVSSSLRFCKRVPVSRPLLVSLQTLPPEDRRVDHDRVGTVWNGLRDQVLVEEKKCISKSINKSFMSSSRKIQSP